ncbi:DUF5686 and carboxypeptidase regulatory-like domain-containing protein [uncultured Lacinutrix sp.]|uniref:DUF5686 and carboxypeptidase regulatory-like domain-containing protein n=1 Tax=uncultured Lacinutrix sp. TaxID=574032 RepID=UPI0026064527|nr:DUF5686 and carboxypeptidase regulatory-like domain-containing protein [uncultured Lacinutrix sp.]
MTKYQLLLAFYFILNISFAQITGSVVSEKNEPLSAVNVYIDNTYIGTSTNNDGNYTLNFNQKGQHTVVFKYLGYKTIKKEISIKKFPYTLNVQLEAEDISLAEVEINSDENPADGIIRKAISKRKAMLEKLSEYRASYYSRGLLRIIDAPEKLLGQEIGDLEGALDSTRSGIIYLSETISELEYQRPKLLKEKIIASKVSGDDNGFSFNNAANVNFDFYENTVDLANAKIVSPIADFAFNYYEYKLEGVFFDERGNLINKIKTTSKRPNDKAFSGYVYIVEDDWHLYAVDLNITGFQVEIPPVDFFFIQQNYSYSEKDDMWVKLSLTFDLDFGMLGIKGDGRFIAGYSDWDFKPDFPEKTFSRELLSFGENSNKKDSTYWKEKRSVPLTEEESTDYIKKDSIRIVRESKPYLDSIDKKNNKFKPLGSLLGGYTYQNSFKDYSIGITSPIEGISFNTVQGWNANMNLTFNKNYDEFRRYLFIKTTVNYGEADKRLRANSSIRMRFNATKNQFLTVSGGVEAKQFNNANPISRVENAVSSLFFEDNYAKFYDLSYAKIAYSQEVFNGLRVFTDIAYERRKALFNNTNYVLINQSDDVYTSNNPINETAYNIAPFSTHNIMKFNATARINFAQYYLTYPDGKFNIPGNKYPTLNLSYEKGFSSNNSNYNFDQFKAQLFQNVSLGTFGDFRYNVKGGIFSNADNIAFVDYHHFNGNQTHIKLNGSYTNSFKNLPYYALSTNDSYGEFHLEHNFKGYIMNKLPLLRALKTNLIIGTNIAATKNNKPYNEFSIGLENLGFGKFRLLRVDYVRSYQSGFINDAVMFGISL